MDLYVETFPMIINVVLPLIGTVLIMFLLLRSNDEGEDE